MPADPDLRALRDLAVELAVGAGKILIEHLAGARIDVDTKSSSTDMVTEVDRASEAFITSALAQRRPDDGLLGEEGTQHDGTSGVRWVIDPLDGTTNYLYGYPAFSVSIAAEVDGETAVGVVRDPLHDETFSAVRGDGAFCNDRQLRVGGPPTLATALVATGFAYKPEARARQAAVLTHVLPRVRDIRRAGSAALDLCSLAHGRVDCYYERGMGPWDFGAGAFIAKEAGAWVGDLEGGPPSSAIVVGAPPHLAEAFVDLLRDAEAGLAP
ncbi:MAG: inositol monophosphatase [Actinobacteria bacterium]|nr:inositol monophosphatase [Actinomycetota bacterium]